MRQTRTQKSAFHQPDAAAVEQAIRQNRWTTTEIVLHLAWNAGLSRKEIYDLTWDQVDLDAALLHLPDRDVPLEKESTVTALRQWKNRFRDRCQYVAASTKHRERVTDVYISAMTRTALNAVGQTDAQLKDLRYAYILRQIEEHGLPYALRVSGLNLTGYNNALSAIFKEAGIRVQGLSKEKPGEKPDQEPRDRMQQEYILWKIMQKNTDNPGGIALWLIQQMGLKITEIINLTWNDVDFDAGTIALQDEIRPMTRSVARILRAEQERRQPGDDPHVILSIQSRNSPAPERLGVLIREILIHGGLDDVTALDVRLGMLRRNDWEILRSWVEEHNSITPAEAAPLLELGVNAAWQRLNTLTQMGYLVHVGHKYYAATKTPPANKLKDAIYQIIEEEGSITCKKAEERLGIPSRQIGYILRNMAAAGELYVPTRGNYVLPE